MLVTSTKPTELYINWCTSVQLTNRVSCYGMLTGREQNQNVLLVISKSPCGVNADMAGQRNCLARRFSNVSHGRRFGLVISIDMEETSGVGRVTGNETLVLLCLSW